MRKAKAVNWQAKYYGMLGKYKQDQAQWRLIERRRKASRDETENDLRRELSELRAALSESETYRENQRAARQELKNAMDDLNKRLQAESQRYAAERMEAQRQLAALQEQHKRDAEAADKRVDLLQTEIQRHETGIAILLDEKDKLKKELDALLIVCGRVWVRDLAREGL